MERGVERVIDWKGKTMFRYREGDKLSALMKWSVGGP